MICHSCDTDGLAVLIRVEQTGVSQSDAGHDIAYAHTVVFACAHCRGSEIEIHSHDCFDHEDVFDQYNWYLLGPADTAQLRSFVEGCPSPLSAECPCAVHDTLRTTCRSLPSTSWLGRADEAALHVYRGYLEVKNGRPSIAAERKNSS